MNRKPNGYWTYQRCKEESSKYKTRREFRINSTSYIACVKHKWLDDFFPIKKQKPRGYWTYDRCKEESLKYKTRKEFYENSSSAYDVSYKNGWIDLFCLHMTKLGNTHKRCVYIWEFDDHSVYVGITCNYNRRIYDHITKPNLPVYIHLKNHKGFCKQLTEYLSIDIVGKIENDYIELYRRNGWWVLNKAKGGSLGGNTRKWTYEKCKNVALKCKTKKELIEKYNTVSIKIRKNKWFELIEHFIESRKPNGYWTYDRCKKLALECQTKKEMNEKFRQPYDVICKNKWFELIEHFTELIKPNGYWTYDICKKLALECQTKKEMNEKYKQSYNIIRKNKWFELIEHFTELIKPKGYWTYEKCQNISLKCKTKKELTNEYTTVYEVIRKNKWFELYNHFN